MGFATKWLAERALFPVLFRDIPDSRTGIILAVPAYNEPGIRVLLDSLASCDPPFCKVEILIIVNAKEGSGSDIILNNQKCIEDIDSWKRDNPDCFFRVFAFNAGIPEIKGWGVGLARKTAMDEALRRLNEIDYPEGVIVCLDADCSVEKNYFVSIAEHLLRDTRHTACSIYFEHPLDVTQTDENIIKYIIMYELHLRYFLWANKFSGFPWAVHTVGSALAVKAFQYMKAGGMNRRQAGEDFYFIQKLAPLDGYFSLNKTAVYPSPRESLRVPFGTGATISRMMRSNGEQLLTYNFDAFRELRSLFTIVDKLYQAGNQEAINFYQDLPAGLRSFISEKEWTEKIREINANTAGSVSFLKRFYGWFNMFRIVRYLNYVHGSMLEKKPVTDSATDLLRTLGHSICHTTASDLLTYMRQLEKNG